MANETKIVITAQTAQAESAMRSLGQSVDGISRTLFNFSGVLGTLGGALSVTAFAGLIKSSIDAADRMADLAKTTSLTVNQLAGLEFAASQSGTDLEAVAKGVSKLSEEMGKAPDKFAKVGITAKDPLQALQQLADVFVSIEDPQQRAAFASEALGKQWKELAPLLSEGGTAIGEMATKGQQMAGDIDTLAQNSDRFNDSLDELKKRIKGSGNALTSELLPSLIATVDELNKLSESGTSFLPVGAAIKTVFETLVVTGANVGYVFKQTGIEIGGIAAQLMALARGDFKGFSRIGKMMKEDAERARKEMDSFNNRILNPQVSQAPKKPLDKVDTSGVKGMITSGGAGKKKQAFDPEGDFWFAVEEAQIKNAKKAQDDFAKSAEEAQKIIFDIDPIARASNEWEKLVALKEKGLLTDEQIGASYKKTFESIAKDGDDAFKSLESAVRGWGNAFTDEMTKMIRTGKADFSTLADSIINDLIRIQVQKRITAPLIGDGTDKNPGILTGAIDSVFKSFGFADGGVMTSRGPLPLKAYASGGVATSPQLAIFGEGRMNEAFVPLPDGRSIPVSLKGGGAAQVIVSQPITIDARGADAGVVERIRAMMPAFIAENSRVVVGAVNQALVSRGSAPIRA